MPVSPPADAHCSHETQQTVHLNLTVLLCEGKDQFNLVSFILVILIFQQSVVRMRVNFR